MYSQYEILNFGTFLKIYFTKKMLKKKASERLDTSEKKLHQNLTDTSKMKTVIIDNALDVRVSSIFIKHQFS